MSLLLAADGNPWPILLFVAVCGAAMYFYEQAHQQKGRAEDAEAKQERLRRRLAKKNRENAKINRSADFKLGHYQMSVFRQKDFSGYNRR